MNFKKISILLLMGAMLTNFGCSSSSQYQKSDHFDGDRFFNPAHPQRQSWGDIFKFLTTYDPKPWPKNVENLSKPMLPEKLKDHEAAVTFVNHATVLIQLNGYNILTDPVWAERASPVSFAGPRRVRKPGIELENLPKIDFVIISHNHYDHMDLETIKELNKRFQPFFFVPLGDKDRIEKMGVQKVFELDWWQTHSVNEDVQIMFTPTQHFSGRTPFTFNTSLWGSYVIHFKGKKIYFGGDAGYSSHYKEIENHLGPMDLSFIPIGAYEPRWFMKLVHMNPEEAVQAHLDLKSKKSVGIHFGTFQLTEEKIDQPIIDLKAAMTEKKVPESDFIVLTEGETRHFLFEND